MIDYDPTGELTADPGDVPGWDGRLRVEPDPPESSEEGPVSVREVFARIAPPVPLMAADLAAHVHDLLAARGQNPWLTDANRDSVEAAATYLLGALGVPFEAPPPDTRWV
ncbi:hypothetical protein [Cryptosporangium minutisporangium]|uniref:Uncharacterized protein n=1 Tax=Cryptosporangium minutisporangium TaxID=113569 RepID=A0ABP6T1T6_9ACTN